MKNKKIGIVVADYDEYTPFLESAKVYNPQSYNYFNRLAVQFDIENTGVVCINCGIGKVNAATAATHLADIGCTYILNFGLSGGISGVHRGEIVLPDKFLEHDFDLTGIGYKPCEKPSQKYIYEVDNKLLEKAQSAIGECVHGTAVCGDRFICNKNDSNFLRKTFGATTCDMETAAIASVCDMADIPYLSLRRVSDDAGEDAYANYSEMNTGDGQTLSEVFLKVLEAICD
ncbi:MAG: 5'-methylthioadenosine/S-adenosylhomocysteine nucleosidase [Ruminococcaceae bacterium]|nr:5'-methylthioadenosine/S-adenosylhomocysteine nucleosidase [Oscillospiraceae bacterium]